jgi:predicted dehydrogenase
MKLRLAFMGFRHGHIISVYNSKHADLEIVGACEEHPETRASLEKSGKVKITHDNFKKMLDEVDFDILAIGDYYGRRGKIIIEALKQGKHVISDKPICTALAELDEIDGLARKKHLSVGCQLSLRDNGVMIALQKLTRSGELGEVHSISFNGQHPLNYGSRPGWYFEEGKHGGTINDIAIHAINLIPWLVGQRFIRVDAARNWNAALKEVSHFKDGALMMLTMENGCGALGDVSYFAPNSFGYTLPMSWRFTLWGNEGVAETSRQNVVLYRDGEKTPRNIQPEPTVEHGYLDCFLREIKGESRPGDITTGEVITSSRNTLLTQRAADKGLHDVELE